MPAMVTRQGGLEVALTFCQDMRIAGIADLFLTGKATELHQCLQHSGQAYAYFLTSAPDTTTTTSRGLPFFDAVAAGDLQLAEQIARMAQRTFAPGEEYEEDFLFVDFVMQHEFLGRSASVSEACLATPLRTTH